MPLIITMKSGHQWAVKGESWKPFNERSPLGTMTAVTLSGNGLLIMKCEIAGIEEIPDAKWKAEKARLAAEAEQGKHFLNRVKRIMRLT